MLWHSFSDKYPWERHEPSFPPSYGLNNTTAFFIIKGFRTIAFIFIVISTTFWSICPPAFFRCLSNSGTYTELRTTSFIESTGLICSDSVSHNRLQVLSIPVFPNDKNHHASSQKFRQLISLLFCNKRFGIK